MKALIIGTDPTGHEVLVQNAFEAGGGVNSDIYEITAFNQTVVGYAIANGYDAIIYSYTGEESYFSLANSNPDIMIFMPSDEYIGDLQQLVLTDYTPTEDDYEFTSAYGGSQSNSNGYICGQLFYIAAQRGCTLQEARICANATKDEDGIIDVSAAIAYSGDIELTISSISASRTSGLSVSLTLGRVVDATNYKIYRKEQSDSDYTLISTQTSLTYTDTLPDYGVYTYKYYAYNDNLSSDYSSTVTIKYGAPSLYEVTSDTYSEDACQGFLIVTNPLTIIENGNLIFGDKYQINYSSTTLGIKFYHGGSSLELTEIQNHEVFMARGKIIAFELPSNQTIEFNEFNLVKA